MNRRTEWKRWIAGAAVTGCAALMLMGLRGRAQNRNSSAMPRYVLLEREAVVAQPPQLVSDGRVNFAEWSPDGRRVIVFRAQTLNTRPDPQSLEPPPVEVSLMLWNPTAKHGLTAWKHNGPTPSDGLFATGKLSWLPGTQTALLPIQWLERGMQPDAQGTQQITETPHYALLLIDALRDHVREVPQTAWLPYSISPTKPQIVLHDSKDNTARILDGSGAPGPPLALPKEQNLAVEWMPDGSALLLWWFEKNAGEKAGDSANAAKLIQRFARMDSTTGAVTRLDKMPAFTGGKAAAVKFYVGPLRVRQTTQILSEGAARHRAYPLWLETDIKGDSERTLLCADAANAQLSPRGDSVLYLSQDAAWVAPLNRVPREAFVQALRAAVISNARQAGLALIMYSQDYDEMLPPSGDVVSPYLKDDAILDGLNYTYSGGALKDIEYPAQTILGTYPGPGGVAIIYADGHVKWNNKP